MKKRKVRVFLTSSLAVLLLSPNLTQAAYSASAQSTPEFTTTASEHSGKWMTGEYHAHTFESNDAQESLKSVLDAAFEQNGFDWMALADHLRVSDRDDEGVNLPGGSIPMSQGIIDYQNEKIKKLQAEGKYAGKIIFSGFEWDMPQYDHAAVGIVTDHPGSAEALKAINQFEYLFTNRDVSMFDPADVAKWSVADKRSFSTKEDTRTAMKWLSSHYPDSYVLINHPSRKNGTSSELKIEDIRDFNNIDPNLVFGFEGMLGNQMASDRGETPETYGGTDVKVAQLGGMWDALLGEGRRFWNFANSDFHFKTKNDQFSSGYWPGEYSKNYTWVDGSDINAVVDGMRSGKSFSVFGDLINALEFNVSGDGQEEEMGGELDVKQGDDLELTIRFKSPQQNNNGDAVKVDHVDLISGEVHGKVDPGTPDYTKATNDSTQVLKRFTSEDWTTDSEGYNVIKYKVEAVDKDRYFRLRGTNLGTDVAGETVNGEPQIDPKNNTVDNLTRFEEINARNYSDMWFYSNPIFVDVESYTDQQAVNDTMTELDLGDTSAVTSDQTLPTEGKHGTSIVWKSSNPVLMTNAGKITFQPKKDTKLTLTATIQRGLATETKAFEVTLSGDDRITPLALHSTLKTENGQSYLSGDWTNHSVSVSVYASVYIPGADVSIQLANDVNGNFLPYESGKVVEISEEGQHQLQFKATDSLENTTTLPIAVNIDRTAPVITLKGDSHLNLTQGNGFKDPGAEVADKVGIAGAILVTGTVDVQTPGTYKLKYNATDLAGNAATEVVRTVVVTAGTGSGGGNNNGGGSGPVPTPAPTATPSPTGQPATTPRVELEVKAQQGGTGTLKDVGSFTIPAGALSGNSEISFSVVATGETPAKGDLQAVSVAVELTSGKTGMLNKPVELSLNYDAAQITSGHKAAIYYYNEQLKKWIYVGGQSQTAGIITANVNQFAKYAVFNYQAPSITDLNNHWSSTFTDRLIGMGVMKGYEDHTFRPNEEVTRTQFASMIVRALGLQSMGSTMKFADQSAIPSWAANDVAAAVNAGILRGYEVNGKMFFEPLEKITRAEMSVMLANALNANAHKQTDKEGNFADLTSIPQWAQASVKAGVKAGILGGFEDHTFRPENHATRAEAAATIYKLLEALYL
ncbi:S-layer homology domain-containing protein [Paenibacillus nitricinens]|uniref:S-layer homology domain-containing protein n=1 Tax=Paenibacillus nitricinens TaxID=3367691 RepID=UPI003F85CC4D